MEPPYEWLDHTADIQFRAYGEDLGEAFANSCQAMFTAMTDTETLEEHRSIPFQLKAEDLPSLLFELLDHLIFLRDSEQLFLKRVRIDRITQNQRHYAIEGAVFGDYAERYQHLRYLDIKSVTYHDMTIEKKTAGPRVYWEASVVLDI